MVKYYSRGKDDYLHLYKYIEETDEFWQMDHCWTGEGEWILIGKGPVTSKNFIEIDEEIAKHWEVGDHPNNTYPRKKIKQS